MDEELKGAAELSMYLVDKAVDILCEVRDAGTGVTKMPDAIQLQNTINSLHGVVRGTLYKAFLSAHRVQKERSSK